MLNLSANAGEALSRDEIVRLALARNPELQTARLEIRRAEVRHAGAGLLPNPTVAAEVLHDDPLPSADRQISASLTFSQSLPLAGKLALAKSLSSVEIEAAKAEVADRARRLAAAVEQGIVEIQTLADLVALRVRQAAISTELADFINEKHLAGEMLLADALQARLEAKSFCQEIESLEIQRQSKLAELKTLIGMAPQETLEVSPEVDLDPVDSNLADALKRRGDAQLADLSIRRADGEVALEKASKWEDLTLGVTVANERMQDDPSGRGNDWFAGVGVSIPLPLWNDNRHAVEAKRVGRLQAALRSQGLAKQIEGELASAEASIASYRSLLAGELADMQMLAEANLAEQEKVYKVGQGPLINVLRARENLLKLEESRLRLRGDLGAALVRLRAAAGLNVPQRVSQSSP